MALEPSYLTHIAVGTLAVLLYWVALGSRKGSPRHRQAGRRFLWVTAAVLATVGALLFGGGRTFAAPEAVQFCYLVLCVVTVASTGFLALRRRDSLARFRGAAFRTLGVTAFAAGALLLAIGLHGALLMPTIFSVIGLSFGGGHGALRLVHAGATPELGHDLAPERDVPAVQCGARHCTGRPLEAAVRTGGRARGERHLPTRDDGRRTRDAHPLRRTGRRTSAPPRTCRRCAAHHRNCHAIVGPGRGIVVTNTRRLETLDEPK